MSALARAIARFEQIARRLPEPIALFAATWLAVLVASHALTGATARLPDGAPIAVVDLLGADQLPWLLTSIARNMLDFPPLGAVLVLAIAVGVAEQVGLLDAVLRRGVGALPAPALLPGAIGLGVLSTLAGDAGYLVLPPLVARAFERAGRPPLAGVLGTTVGIGLGYAANPLLIPLDPLLAGMTTAAAQTTAPGLEVAATANLRFTAASTVLVIVTATLVLRAMLPSLHTAVEVETPDERGEGVPSDPSPATALVTAAVVLSAWALAVWLPGGPLQGTLVRPDGRTVPAWSDATVPAVATTLFTAALVYGRRAGRLPDLASLQATLQRAAEGVAGYLVLALVAGQTLAVFGRSQLAAWLSVGVADATRAIGLGGAGVLLGVLGAGAAVDVVLSSASAKWALFAPVLVPAGLQLGVPPDFVQMAYRIGDACINPVGPLNPYLPIVLVTVRRYRPDATLGSLIAWLAPMALACMVTWTAALLFAWAAGMDLGPG